MFSANYIKTEQSMICSGQAKFESYLSERQAGMNSSCFRAPENGDTNFQKFEMAMNPPYRIFKTLQGCTYYE